MSDLKDKIKNHPLIILVSVALCAAEAHYWSYRVKRDRPKKRPECGAKIPVNAVSDGCNRTPEAVRDSNSRPQK